MASNTVSAKSLKTLFPTGPEWEGMTAGVMRELSDGIAVQAERDRENAKKILSDFFPESSTIVDEWEAVFRLPSGQFLTASQRAARLASAWRGVAPGSYTGMNEIFQLSGLAVKARPLAPGEDPRVLAAYSELKIKWLTKCGTAYRCGLNSRCGEKEIIQVTQRPVVFANGRRGNEVKNRIIRCSATTRCGLNSRAGEYRGYVITPIQITIPANELYWPMIFVIEGYGGDFANVPAVLKTAFEFTTYKIKPLFMWAITRVSYVSA